MATLAGVTVCVASSWPRDSPVVPRHGGHPVGDPAWGRLFLGALVLAFLAYLGGLWALRRRAPGSRVVLGLAAAIQLAPLAAPLLVSTDAWTYWSYARLHDPYTQTPAADPVSAPYVGTDWLHWKSVYGPAFSLATEPVGLTRSPDVAAWTFKVVAALCVLALVAWAARRGAFAAAFIGWNPLLAVHFAGGGHNDAPMMALVAAALVLGSRRRAQAAGVAWALAAGVKWIPLLLLPLRALEARATGRRVGHLGFAVTVVAVAVAATAAYGGDWLGTVGPLA
ncbi:MAG TPA: glycosyltransferase 87 family protein, partial [Solirubrobacteraceae bacterium]